jgi:antagonist of KipI
VGIRILNPGFHSSIQDLGRIGYQKYGVIVGGSMDHFAHRVSNILVGNPENSPTIEMTIKGAAIEFHQDHLFSICGGELNPVVNGEPIDSWRPIFARKGDILEFGRCQKGCRAYMAVAGGFDIPSVMGSYSTYLRAGIGGFEGRLLKKGDFLKFKSLGIHPGKLKANWTLSPGFLKKHQKSTLIRYICGQEYSLFSEESQEKFNQEEYFISSKSDRMGYRLEGPKLCLSESIEMISEAVTMGTVQVPPEGQPIILLADRQTIGGYPKIAQIAQVDLPVIAQTKPGDKVRFQEISLQDAQHLFLHREKEIRILKKQVETIYS